MTGLDMEYVVTMWIFQQNSSKTHFNETTQFFWHFLNKVYHKY